MVDAPLPRPRGGGQLTVGRGVHGGGDPRCPRPPRQGNGLLRAAPL